MLSKASCSRFSFPTCTTVGCDFEARPSHLLKSRWHWLGSTKLMPRRERHPRLLLRLQKPEERTGFQQPFALFLPTAKGAHDDGIVVAQEASFDRMIRADYQQSLVSQRFSCETLVIQKPQPGACFPQAAFRIATENHCLIGVSPIRQAAKATVVFEQRHGHLHCETAI